MTGTFKEKSNLTKNKGTIETKNISVNLHSLSN